MKAWKKTLGAALLSVACTQAWAVPTLSISPAVATATPGASLGVDVMVSDIADLYTYQFSLAFDPALLKVSVLGLGNFLESSGKSTFGDTGQVDNTAGTISWVFNTLLGPEAGVGGSGVLMHIDFDTLSPGSSALAFSDVLFLDSALNDIAVKAVDGTATVAAVPEPASWMLLGLGAAAAGALRRRRAVAAS